MSSDHPRPEQRYCNEQPPSEDLENFPPLQQEFPNTNGNDQNPTRESIDFLLVNLPHQMNESTPVEFFDLPPQTAKNSNRLRQKSQHYILSPTLNVLALKSSIDKKISGRHFANKKALFNVISEIGTEASLRGFELFTKFGYKSQNFRDFIETIINPVQAMVSNLQIEFRFNGESFFVDCSHG